MAKANIHFKRLRKEYIFPVIDKKLEEAARVQPNASFIKLGVGDIALPLAPAIGAAIHKAVDEMMQATTLRGYGPSEGYRFLREAIAAHEYAHLDIGPSEIFISSGANEDAVNILDILDAKNVIGIPDPTYPVYLDAGVLDGYAAKIVMLPCTEKTRFVPRPPKKKCDIIYLCTPNNPTGLAMTKAELAAWVAYAKKHRAILICDNAYAAFIRSPDVPKSIFEIAGAKEVAIELRSFSKTAGFTGLRCAYAVVPYGVKATLNGKLTAMRDLWDRRQATKTNGVAYPMQRGAAAVFTPQGQKETRAQIEFYLAQAEQLRAGLLKMGQTCVGGYDSPYIWWKTPRQLPSWDFFDLLLQKGQLVTIPGKGFGSHGEGYIRLSAFTTTDIGEVLRRIEKCVLR